MMRNRPLIIFALSALALAVIGAAVWRLQTKPEKLAGKVTAAAPLFVDVAAESGLDFQMNFLPAEQGETFKINLYDHGCGVSVGDYNGDGRDDIYLLNQLGPNALYRNRGDGAFDDVTDEMQLALDDRVCVGAVFADYDNDGDQDLYVTSTRGGNLLFRNEDHTAFVDVTAKAGLQNVGHSQSAVFFDYDRDGWLDLYVAQTAQWTLDTLDDEAKYFPGKSGILTAPKEYNRLYHNEGNGTFVDVTESAQLGGRGWSGDMAIFDYDEDGWLDVLVVCMFGRAQLYRNEHNGVFRDVTLEVLGKTPWGGTGVKVFDFNNDGKLDIYIVDMHSDMWMGLDYSNSYFDIAVQSEKIKFEHSYGPQTGDPDELARLEAEQEDLLNYRRGDVLFGNAFYRALGDGRFAEASAETNTETFWPWGLAVGDYDNDGLVDAFVTSGMGYPFYYWRNYLLMNTSAEAFVDRAFALGIEPPVGGNYLAERINGKPCSRSSRCAAASDFDGDGDLEIIVNNFNARPYYFKNLHEGGNYVALRLQGVASNRDAIGAQVRLDIGGETLVRQVHSAGGYLSCPSKTLHFGLGKREKIDRAEIIWPSGRRQQLDPPPINMLHQIVEPRDAEQA